MRLFVRAMLAMSTGELCVDRPGCAGDDGMNIPTLYTDIESISADRLTLTVGKDGTVGINWAYYVAGSSVNFFDRRTLAQTAVAPGLLRV